MEKMNGSIMLNINDYNNLIIKQMQQENEINQLKETAIKRVLKIDDHYQHIKELEGYIIEQSLNELEYYVKHSCYNIEECLKCDTYKKQEEKLAALHISPAALMGAFIKAYNEARNTLEELPSNDDIEEQVEAALVNEEIPFEEV